MMQPVGLEPAPGFYRHRTVKGAPWQPVEIRRDSFGWHVLLAGKVVDGSARAEWLDIPFLAYRWPLWPISREQFDVMMDAIDRSPPDSPLRRPHVAINLRELPPL